MADRPAHDPSAPGRHRPPGSREGINGPKTYGKDVVGRIKHNLRTPERKGGTLAALVLAGLATLFLVYFVVLIYQFPTARQLQNARVAESTIVYTADGQELTRYHTENRTWVSVDSISSNVKEALIATEDHRFYDHWGVDAQRTLSSVFKTVGGDTQGGSTITMQLARNAFAEIQDDFPLTRKFKEWLIALRLERMYEKDEILEMYLNTVPFLYGAFGIEAASKTYFQKSAYDLNHLEAAAMVGMLKGTAFYNPVRNPERSQERRNVVLEQMVRRGYLQAAEFEQLKDRPTPLRFRRLSHDDNMAPFFAEYLRLWLGDWAEQRGYNLYKDGLRIYTTIDTEMQQSATEAVEKMGMQLQAVADVEWSARRSPYFSSNASDYVSYSEQVDPFAYYWASNPSVLDDFIQITDEYRQAVDAGMAADSALARLRSDPAFVDSVKAMGRRLEAGFVAMDPQTGYVKAWVGGRNFKEDQYDHVTLAKRQPGSTFKPFVYAAAIESGLSPNTQMRDQVVEYVDPDTKRTWRPENVGSSSGQLMTLRDALAFSKNTITAQLVQQIGPRRVADFAHQMGIDSELDPVPSIGLGTSIVSLLEMTKAYATLANGGNTVEPVLVTRIEDRHGNVLGTFSPNLREAISSHTAYTVVDMMRGVVDYGTGQRIRQFVSGGDFAAKTGTTQNGADGWFMLMHPNLVMGSWVGFKSPFVTFRSSYWGQGSHNALYVVGNFIQDVDLPAGEFNPPPGYSVPDDQFILAGYDTQYYDSLAALADSLAGDRWTYDRWDWEPPDLNEEELDDAFIPIDELDGDDPDFAEESASPEESALDVEDDQPEVDAVDEVPVEELSEVDRLNRQERLGNDPPDAGGEN